MTPIKRVSGKRPIYFRGQLLDEKDFYAEQKYHQDARTRHNLTFHSWGVVQGMTVSRQSDTQVSVAPGLAIDSLGREVQLEEPATLDVSGFSPNQMLYILIAYEEDEGDTRKSEHGEGFTRTTEYAVVSASPLEGAGGAVTLAIVHLDSKAKVSDQPIDYSRTQYATSVIRPAAVGERELADGSVSQSKLVAGLRSGWVRMPFKPHPFEGKKPFRIGPTEAHCGDEGAAGSASIPLPLGVTHIVQLRIAGDQHEGLLKVSLYRCGWDSTAKHHEKASLLTREYPGVAPPAGQDKVAFEFTERVDWVLDAQYHALSIVVEAAKRTSILLLAAEFSY